MTRKKIETKSDFTNVTEPCAICGTVISVGNIRKGNCGVVQAEIRIGNNSKQYGVDLVARENGKVLTPSGKTVKESLLFMTGDIMPYPECAEHNSVTITAAMLELRDKPKSQL